MKLSKKGFTLIELMVVIVIVGILAAVAIPKFVMASHKAKCSEYPTILMQVYTAEIAYHAEASTYSDGSVIGVDLPLISSQSKWFTYDVTDDGAAWATDFLATAEVKAGISIGDADAGDQATIDETSDRDGTADLIKYTTNWN